MKLFSAITVAIALRPNGKAKIRAAKPINVMDDESHRRAACAGSIGDTAGKE